MNYKKLTIYSVIINIIMNLLFFVFHAYINEDVGYYLFFGIELAIFIIYYIKRYKVQYTKEIIKKDILLAVLWIVLSFIIGFLLANLFSELFPNRISFESGLEPLVYIVLAGINMLFALLILMVNLTNLFLKKTGLSDKKNIIISIPTGIIIYSLILYILIKVLQII